MEYFITNPAAWDSKQYMWKLIGNTGEEENRTDLRFLMQKGTIIT